MTAPGACGRVCLQSKAEEKEIDHGKSKPLVKGEPDDPYANLIKKKGKRKGGASGGAGAAAAPVKPKAVKLAYDPSDLVMWEKLGFKPPATSEDCPALHEQLLAKREVRRAPLRTLFSRRRALVSRRLRPPYE